MSMIEILLAGIMVELVIVICLFIGIAYKVKTGISRLYGIAR